MTTWLNSFVTSVISWILILNFSVGSTVFSIRQAHAQAAAAGSATFSPEQRALHHEIGTLLMDPVISEIENSPQDAGFELHMSPTDPLVDQDPYFLRSQAWVTETSAANSDDVLFSQSGSELTIRPRGQMKSLRLNLPLAPVLATDEYIFLSATSESFFSSRGNAQGLFVIPYQRLLSASVSNTRVPVFFLPLPGTGWTGNISAREIPHHDVVVLRNSDGTPLPILTDEVRSVVRVETTNMLFAISQAMLGAYETLGANTADADRLRASMTQAYTVLAREIGEPGRTAPSAELAQRFASHNADLLATVTRLLGGNELDLPRGSTAGFGMLYTGFDLAHPEQGSTIFSTARVEPSRLRVIAQKVLGAFGISKAHAIDPQVARFLAYSTRVLAISGVVFIAGVVARHTILRQEAARRIREGAERGDTRVSRRLSWDIFAHSMTTLSQIPTVWSARTLRWVLDRAGVSENGIVRSLFNSTLGFGLRTSDRTPVNSKTLVLGVGVLGGVDTALVAVQGYFLLQWMAHGLAWIFPALAPRVHAAYDAGNAATSLYLMLGVVQNMVAWMTAGAYNFAHDVQTFRQTEAERSVADAMRVEGRDPTAPEHRLEYDRRVRAYVRDAMHRAGLPGEQDFLFDANTLYARIQGFFGYHAPTSPAPSPEAATTDAHHPRAFRAAERPGLVPRALAIALRNAETALREHPGSQEHQQAVTLLREARTQMSVLRTFLGDPRQFLTRTGLLDVARNYRAIRENLVSLTFEGTVGEPIERLPEAWTTRHPDGARAAAQAFRSAYFGITDNAPPAHPMRARVGRFFRAPFRFLDHTFERWQIRRAYTRAAERFTAETGESAVGILDEASSENPSELRRTWDRLFQRELVRVVGLFPDYQQAEIIQRVEDRVETRMRDRLAEGSSFMTEIASLSPRQRNERIALQRADLFAEAYSEIVIQEEAVSATSPMQPGVFQRIRQIPLIASSRAMTGALRLTEGLMSNTRYSRGLWSQLTRVVPLLEDVTQGNLITLKGLPVAATVAYWWQAAVWGTAYPRMTWLINMMLVGSTIRGPWMTTMRMTGNLGIRPNDSVMSMVKYGVIGSFATMWGMFFFPMFQQDIVNGLNSIGTFCTRLLTGH